MADAAERRILREIGEIRDGFERLAALSPEIAAAADLIGRAIRAGGKVLFCGNGGSAADSQHLAAEFVGRYESERAPLPAVALTVDTSALTAIGNDYGFDQVFARQVRALGRRGDVLVAISTSGRSANVLAAIDAAREAGMSVIAMTGASETMMSARADVAIRVPASRTNRVQEMHIAVGHMICGIVESALA